ncbi:hypothetical protein OKW30_001255 [Paraburkholderia sp. Clong3]|nr:hypothetical protein [Paraburkholderia sp. CI2]
MLASGALEMEYFVLVAVALVAYEECWVVGFRLSGHSGQV